MNSALPRRTTPIFQIWESWAMAGSLALHYGGSASFVNFVRTTTLVTMAGMLESGMRPASHPTSATKE